MDESKIIRVQAKNQIYENVKYEVENLEKQLPDVINSEEKGSIYWQLSKKYKVLYWGFVEEPKIFKNTEKEDYFKNLVKSYLWNSVYYREKCLQIIKEHNNIEANDGIFMDIVLKYIYFVKNDYDNIEENEIRFERFGESDNEKINIIINDLEYAKRGLYYSIKFYEKEKNYEEFHIWYEVLGDLYLIIQLLLMKAGRDDFLDNAKQALKCYKKSNDCLKKFAKPEVGYGGIYGLPYQTNFFGSLLKSFGFTGYSQSSIPKMRFIEEKLLKKRKGMDFMEYLENPSFPNRIILKNKIEKLILDWPILEHRSVDFENWEIVCEFIHNQILAHNYEQGDLKTTIESWKSESDMQKWVDLRMKTYLPKNKGISPFFIGRERKMGGGNCDHYYKNIPICDKWKRDSNAQYHSLEINYFIDEVYEKHYEQIRSYANDVKLAILLVVDSRSEIRNKSPNLIKDTYKFIVDREDGIVTAIFIVEITDKSPSER